MGVDSGGPKEAEVQSYSPGSASVPSWVGILAPFGDDAALCQIILTTSLVAVADVVVFVLHNQLFLRYQLVFFSRNDGCRHLQLRKWRISAFENVIHRVTVT